MPTPQSFLERDAWARFAKKGAAEGLALRKGFPVQIRAINAEARTIETVISTPTRDRHNDSVSVSGWNLKDYRKNPVVLWCHDHSIPAIARGPVSKDGDLLVSVDEFPAEGIHPMADMVFALAMGKFLNAKSVGFMPDEWTYDEAANGYNFLKQQLLEHSWVNVPANPEALRKAKEMGIDLAPMREWAEAALDLALGEQMLAIPRAALERAFEISGDGRLLIPVHGSKRIVASPPAADTAAVQARAYLASFDVARNATELTPWLHVAGAMKGLLGGDEDAPAPIGDALELAYFALADLYQKHGKADAVPSALLVRQHPLAGQASGWTFDLESGRLERSAPPAPAAPTKAVCDMCKGSGTMPCEKCQGTGKMGDCPTCGGTGMNGVTPCADCDGTGDQKSTSAVVEDAVAVETLLGQLLDAQIAADASDPFVVAFGATKEQVAAMAGAAMASAARDVVGRELAVARGRLD